MYNIPNNLAQQVNVDVYARLLKAFPGLPKPPDISYVPGVIANQAIPRGQNDLGGYSGPGQSAFVQPAFFDQIKVINPVAYLFPNDPLVAFRHGANYEVTPQQGGDPVVEFITYNPVAIRIRGILWDQTGNFPYQQIKDLLNVFYKGAQLDISSQLMNAHGVTSIYIDEIDFPDPEGFADSQPFVIEAFSYSPATIIIQDNPVQTQ